MIKLTDVHGRNLPFLARLPSHAQRLSNTGFAASCVAMNGRVVEFVDHLHGHLVKP